MGLFLKYNMHHIVRILGSSHIRIVTSKMVVRVILNSTEELKHLKQYRNKY